MRGAESPLRATVVVSASRGLSLVMGLALGVLSAAYFGTTPEKDSYLIAQTIPTLLATILVGGIYSTLMISLAEIGRREGATGQKAYVRRTLLHLTLALVPPALVAFAFPQSIIRLVAPGFAPSQVDLSAALLRVSLPTALAAVFFAVIKALFNSWNRFAVPGMMNLLVGACSILTLVAFLRPLGIFTLAVGPLAGTFAAALLLGCLARAGTGNGAGVPPPRREAAVGFDEARRFWSDFLPMGIGANFGQVNLLVNNMFGSYLPSGSITMLGFAFVIISSTELLFVFSLAETVLPRFAATALRGQAELGDTFRSSLRYMVLITAPLSAGALCFGLPIVRLLFERGEFAAESSTGVAAILACYALEISFMGYFALFWRLLVSRRRFAVIAWASVGAVALNALLNWLLVGPFGVNGIALATTFVTLLHALALAPLVRREIGQIHAPGDGALLLKVFGAATVMGVVVLSFASVFERAFNAGTEIIRAIEVIVGLGLGAATYFGLLHAARVRQVREIGRRILQAALPPARQSPPPSPPA